MLVINQRKKLFLKLETVYFCDDYENYRSDADIVLFYLSGKGIAGARPFNTLRFDLTKSEEELYKDLNSSTRRRIRQASEKDDCFIHIDNSPGIEDIIKFCDSYDEFASTKGIKVADRELLMMARRKDALCISFIYDQNGNHICGTADIHDDKTVLGMYAYSHFRKFTDNTVRNQVSNANRYLYWEQIRYYKQKNFKIMDMGGLGLGKEGEGLDSVDEFKMGFGGKVETLYHFYMAKSLMGKILIHVTNKNKTIEY